MDVNDRRPLACAEFLLQDANGMSLALGATDVNGNLCFSCLPNGTYYLCEVCPPPGYQANQDFTSITLSTFENQIFLEITNTPCPVAEAGITVMARMQDTMAPLPGVTMSLTSVGARAMATATTDANGKLQFTGLAYGTYQIDVVEQPMGIVAPGPVQVTVSPDNPNPVITMDFTPLVSPTARRW